MAASYATPEVTFNWNNNDHRYTTGCDTVIETSTTAATLGARLNQYQGRPMNQQTIHAIQNETHMYLHDSALTGTNYTTGGNDWYDTGSTSTGTIYVGNNDNLRFIRDNLIYGTGGPIHYEWKEPSAAEVLKGKIKSQLRICVASRSDEGLLKKLPQNEQIAIATLREDISESDYRRYLKYGFLSVQAASGMVYQIFRSKWHLKVWDKGKVVEEICVRLAPSNNCPPTDNVIAFRTMIMFDEEAFRKSGNVYNMRNTEPNRGNFIINNDNAHQLVAGAA